MTGDEIGRGQVSERSNLVRSLEAIRDAASQVIYGFGSEKALQDFCTVIYSEQSTIAQHYDLATDDPSLLKISSIVEETLRRLATARVAPADRARLAMSYARSLRADIDRFLAVHRSLIGE